MSVLLDSDTTLGVNWWWDSTDAWNFELSTVRSPFKEVLVANGARRIQCQSTGLTAGKRPFIDGRKDLPSDKQPPLKVRQRGSACGRRAAELRGQGAGRFSHTPYQRSPQKGVVP